MLSTFVFPLPLVRGTVPTNHTAFGEGNCSNQSYLKSTNTMVVTGQIPCKYRCARVGDHDFFHVSKNTSDE